MALILDQYMDTNKYIKLSAKMSDMDIARRYGVSRTAILNWKRANGLVKGRND